MGVALVSIKIARLLFSVVSTRPTFSRSKVVNVPGVYRRTLFFFRIRYFKVNFVEPYVFIR